ncbi:hypothetical protein [Marinobacter sp. SS13-12]|uniref:hypothetical protein n=1 Tax=Marinobacter sp. SS13-12 TaxID=3050451 RepID=UPI002557641A|nr:hypothetical protein [Marinobacter sp. SS13-12]MDK8465920.1 hypothetical protein [Marinobacter sp. SS13-12]
MDTLIYLRSVQDLAMYDSFELVTISSETATTYSVFGMAGKRRDSLGDFVTRRYAYLFFDLCESTRDLKRGMEAVRGAGRDRHASL